MIGMLAFLLSALLVLPSCFDDDTITERYCSDGTRAPGDDVTMCSEPPQTTITERYCSDGTRAPGDDVTMCPADDEYDPAGETSAGDPYEGGDSTDMIAGTENNDFIHAGGGDDTVKGMDGDDDIKGEEGNDILMGGAGNDKLDGGPGNDELHGNEGDDELTGGAGSNTLDGGDGEDIVIYKDFEQVGVDLNKGEAIAVPKGANPLTHRSVDTLAGIENVKGSHGPDTITGNAEANVLKGLDGADTISGGEGDDTIIPNRPANVAGDGTKSANVSDPNPDDPNSTTPSNDGEDLVDGGGNGDGGDTISYEGESEQVTLDLATAGNVISAVVPVPAHITATIGTVMDKIVVTGEGTEGDPYVSTIENVIGGFGGDSLTGDNRDNRLEGGHGDDALEGGLGNDTLVGGEGDDGLGEDTAEEGNDTLEGGPGTDTLRGGPGDDELIGGAGKDNLYGGAGSDMIYADDEDLSGTVIIQAGTDDPANEEERDVVTFEMVTKDTDTAEEGMQGVTVTIDADWQVEEVHGSPLNDDITGHTTRDMIFGGDGDDKLNGNGGGQNNDNDSDDFKSLADVLVGEGGDDIYTGNSGSVEVFVVHAGAGNDTITEFAIGEDHLHLLGFTGGHSVYDCNRTSESTGVECILPDDQKVTITNTTGDFSDSLNWRQDLKIVVEAPTPPSEN